MHFNNLELFLQRLTERRIYYFSSDQINTDVRHFFICIKRTDDNLLIFTCCTSQFETIEKYIQKRKLSYKTLVWIPPKNDENPFTEDTFINCNNCFIYTIEQFSKMYTEGRIDVKGEITDSDYDQILHGIHASDDIDEYIKDLLPKP